MKIVSLFSVVRGYNIPIIILAQYLSAIFIFAPDKSALSILLDYRFFIIVFASAITSWKQLLDARLLTGLMIFDLGEIVFWRLERS